MENDIALGAPTPINPAPAGSIVVGHDGSASAQLALDMAVGLAGQPKIPVVVARTWTITTAPGPAQWTSG
ncbi:hypothetical protein GCM10009715_24000 [Paeniglutamicibacter psychrophenolicus]|uniref:Nucleotide-binding universal stress UspA family protein n=1 Tax=Paeniglutamicibacter psychrophenolicus TaxID=257454 RepID=A0ABS4WHZ6_9MICC|nr:universal stress protein [Paeniglutamicibacter psychrophenolicus]MBP2375831.1 nucleotide-binding universal stress UspA family protein [Paeniglutamicibacter psychrophenolicus]